MVRVRVRVGVRVENARREQRRDIEQIQPRPPQQGVGGGGERAAEYGEGTDHVDRPTAGAARAW